MSWGEKPNLPAEWLREVEGVVTDTVVWYRNRGHPRAVAIEQTALALGMSNRKTRSILDHEPIGLKREEYDRTFEAYMRHLDFRADDHLSRIDAIRAKRRQMELVFQ